MAKLAAPSLQLTQVLSDDNIGKCPKFVLDKLKASSKIMKNYHEQAEAWLKDASTACPLTFSFDDVTNAVKDAPAAAQRYMVPTVCFRSKFYPKPHT